MKNLLAVAVFAFCFMLGSCSAIDANPTEICCCVGDQTQITTKNQKVSFSSGNDYFASVDESGLVTANKVGQTNIIVESGLEDNEIPITINPRYTYFEEPFIEFGSTPDKVAGLYGECTSSFGGEYTYLNYGPNKATLVFAFENDALACVRVTLSSKDAGNNTIDIDSYMTERYNRLTSAGKAHAERYTNDINGQFPALITVSQIPEINVVDVEYKPFVSEL